MQQAHFKSNKTLLFSLYRHIERTFNIIALYFHCSIFFSFCSNFDFFAFSTFTVQRGCWHEGILRHDASAPQQSDAFRRCMYTGHGSHRKGLQTMGTHSGKHLFSFMIL